MILLFTAWLCLHCKLKIPLRLSLKQQAHSYRPVSLKSKDFTIQAPEHPRKKFHFKYAIDDYECVTMRKIDIVQISATMAHIFSQLQDY